MPRPFDRYKRVPLPNKLLMGDVLVFQAGPRRHRTYVIVIYVDGSRVWMVNPYTTNGGLGGYSLEYLMSTQPYWKKVLVPPLT